MRTIPRLLPALAALLTLVSATAGQSTGPGSGTEGWRDHPSDVPGVLRELNRHPTVAASDDAKSWRVLFDAYLELSQPPFEVGDDFSLTTIHPGMDDWARVSDWAESNPGMARALLEVRDRPIVGMPYGREGIPANYLDARLFVEVGPESLRNIRFEYLPAVDTIAAWATAEIYRRMEAGSVDDAIDLAMAEIFVLRQFCDREFLAEKWHHINLLSRALGNLRDVFWSYLDKIPGETFFDLAWFEIPYIRPDRNRLLMPEADRIVAQALIDEVFDQGSGTPDPEKFARVFAAIQSREKPLTRFGAARRWKMISTVHDSLEKSQERLALVYDDWWRRWRIREYDPLLDIPTQFERTNRVRYAAVIYSMLNIEDLFLIRNRLQVEVNGTAVAAGICAYHREYRGTWPNQNTKFLQFTRRVSDTDPYDLQFGRFGFTLAETRTPVDSELGRLWIEPGQCVLWSVGQNHETDRPAEHSDDGFAGDIMIWPPFKSIAREQGLLD